MKSILAAVLALFLICTVAKADECITPTELSSAFAKEGIILRGTKADATERMAKVFNENRERVGQPKTEISIFLFGPVMTQDNGPVVIAAAFDKNGCVIPNTVVSLTPKQWIEFMNASGVTVADLVPIDGA